MRQSGCRSARILELAMLSLAVGLIGCAHNEAVEPPEAPATAANLPQVVATNSILCDLTQQVAGSAISLTCLLKPGQDPHAYQARPSDRQAIDSAGLVLYGGFDFAPAIADLVEASSTVPKVAVFEAAVPSPLMGKGHSHDHSEEDEHDHDHGEGDDDDHDKEGVVSLVPDPHVWHSASNNAAIAEVIATNLSRLNPEQSDLYHQNADQLSSQFAQLNGWIQAQVDTVPVNHRRLVTTHDSFRYFADSYGFEIKGALSGLSTEEKPSAGQLTALVEQIKGAAVPAIFAESTANPDLINTIANDAGVKVAEQPLLVEGPQGPGSPGATTQEMLVVNTCTIVNALGGRCEPGDAPL